MPSNENNDTNDHGRINRRNPGSRATRERDDYGPIARERDRQEREHRTFMQNMIKRMNKRDEKEARKNKEMRENIEELPNSLSDSFKDIITALNIDAIADSIKEQSSTNTDIANALHTTKTEARNLVESSLQHLTNLYGANRVGYDQVQEIIGELADSGMSINQIDDSIIETAYKLDSIGGSIDGLTNVVNNGLKELLPSIEKNSAAVYNLGGDVEGYQEYVNESATALGKLNEQQQENYLKTLGMLSTTEQRYNWSSDELMSQINDIITNKDNAAYIADLDTTNQLLRTYLAESNWNVEEGLRNFLANTDKQQITAMGGDADMYEGMREAFKDGLDSQYNDSMSSADINDIINNREQNAWDSITTWLNNKFGAWKDMVDTMGLLNIWLTAELAGKALGAGKQLLGLFGAEGAIGKFLSKFRGGTDDVVEAATRVGSTGSVGTLGDYTRATEAASGAGKFANVTDFFKGIGANIKGLPNAFKALPATFAGIQGGDGLLKAFGKGKLANLLDAKAVFKGTKGVSKLLPIVGDIASFLDIGNDVKNAFSADTTGGKVGNLFKALSKGGFEVLDFLTGDTGLVSMGGGFIADWFGNQIQKGLDGEGTSRAFEWISNMVKTSVLGPFNDVISSAQTFIGTFMEGGFFDTLKAGWDNLWSNSNTSLWSSVKGFFSKLFGWGVRQDSNSKYSIYNRDGSSTNVQGVDSSGNLTGGTTDTGNTDTGNTDTGNTDTNVDGSHKNGLDSVPFDGYIAELHKGERVLTAKENAQYSNSPFESWKENNAAQSVKLSTYLSKLASEAAADRQAWEDKAYQMLNPQAPTNTTGGAGGGGGTGTLEGQDAGSIWKWFTGSGYSKEATAGVMGNMKAESGVNPSSIQGNGKGPAAGICQWENYNTKSARWKQMADYAQSKGKEWTDLQSQLEFVNMELGGIGNVDKYTSQLLQKKVGGLSGFKALTDVAKATEVFEASFERAGIKAMSKRIGFANDFYNQFKAYEEGTPYVPEDQIALIHKGEMVVPAQFNPNNNGRTISTDNSEDIQELISVVKDAVQYLAKVIKDSQPIIQTTNNRGNKFNNSSKFNNSVLGGL